MHEKRHFLLYRKRHHDAQITWPYAYYVTLGSHCKMANSSSELRRWNWYFARETHKDTAVSVWACQAGFWKSTGTSCQLQHAVFHGVCEIATQMGVMRRSKKVSSFELYKFTFTSLRVDCAGACAWLYLGSSANCYSSWQYSRPALLTFLSTTRIHSLLKNLTWQPHWLPRLMSLPRKPTENTID